MPPFTARAITLALTTIAVSIAIQACTSTEALNDPPSATSSPPLGNADAGPDVSEAGLMQYCPSRECPMGYTTCPTSVFQCDVNLLTDTRNCGACGAACPSRGNAEVYSCIEGRCVLTCNPESRQLDCNGIVDDGCETFSFNDEHCGTCGNKCTDPAKPCSDQTLSRNYGCGCVNGKVPCYYGNAYPPGWYCMDVNTDDGNCGTCGNACDPSGGGAPQYSNAYYGCGEKRCGAVKCSQLYSDCDRDVIANGCETPMWTDEDCGTCGNACPEGQFCAVKFTSGQPQFSCGCAPGLSFCGSRAATPGGMSVGECFDLTSDLEHCGSCDVKCPGIRAWEHATPSCEYGACKMVCMQGWGDCNGNMEDDCETRTENDPKNCGGCGTVCDAVAGQACVQGRCVVGPCEPGEEVAR